MGTSVGVKLELPTSVVVHDVKISDEKLIPRGTEITQINGQSFSTREEVELLAKELNMIEGQFDGKTFKIQLTELQLSNLLGALQFEAEGVGTLTYVDPTTMEFGAIGHQIPIQTEEIPPYLKGVLYSAKTSIIQKSMPGKPGYKVAEIIETERIGTVQNNETYGVFGKWEGTSIESLPDPIKVMQENKIELGEATILSALQDEEVEQFSIEITEIEPTQFQFKITDANLLKNAGGIIQGMSGSPIIQNGQFIGAITHMYVERPDEGVGLKILEMLEKR